MNDVDMNHADVTEPAAPDTAAGTLGSGATVNDVDVTEPAARDATADSLGSGATVTDRRRDAVGADGARSDQRPRRRKAGGRRSRRLPALSTVLASAWLLTLGALTLLADYLPFIRRADATVVVDGVKQLAYKQGPGDAAWFGTDTLGKDVFAMCIYFARNTLFIGLMSTLIGIVVGGSLGLIAGYCRGWVDRVLSVFIDSFLAVPALVLAILVVSRLDTISEEYSALSWVSRTWQIIFALSVLAIGPLARIVRAHTLSLREREFVDAARTAGARGRTIIWREITPNVVPVMVTVACTALALLIAAEGALAFLGLGLDDSWGSMIEDNRQRIEKAWWATVFPCLMLLGTVLSFNALGDRLARRFDVREVEL